MSILQSSKHPLEVPCWITIMGTAARPPHAAQDFWLVLIMAVVLMAVSAQTCLIIRFCSYYSVMLLVVDSAVCFCCVTEQSVSYLWVIDQTCFITSVLHAFELMYKMYLFPKIQLCWINNYKLLSSCCIEALTSVHTQMHPHKFHGDRGRQHELTVILCVCLSTAHIEYKACVW